MIKHIIIKDDKDNQTDKLTKTLLQHISLCYATVLYCTVLHILTLNVTRKTIHVSLQQSDPIVARQYCCHSNVYITMPLPGRRLPHLSGFRSAVIDEGWRYLLTQVKLPHSSKCVCV